MISQLDSLAKVGTELYNEVEELLNVIPLLRWMTYKDRPYAKDLEKDSQGRIKVKIDKPHILEDMDYFRQAAISFQKTGKYTKYYPSRIPTSPYKKFWDEEVRRCKEGMVRESDGEWVTGYHYFYLNYSPIYKTTIIGEVTEDGTVQADREAEFPDSWDGDYLFFHYVDQAEKAGKYGSALKARGKGYSFKVASMLNRNYFLFKGSKSYAMAADTEYLDTDGILDSKAWDIFSHVIKYVGFAKKLTLINQNLHKKSGYKKLGDSAEYGFKSEIIGVTLKNDPDKARGKRGKLIAWEEAGSFPNLTKSWRIAQRSLEEGLRVFGFMVAFGTGGEQGDNFAGLYDLFYKPEAYKIFWIYNCYDKNSENAKCGFFVPDYLNVADCYDKDGNSDVIKALVQLVEARLIVFHSSTNPTDYAQFKAEGPFTPQEAVMRTEGTVFSVADIKEYLISIKPNLEHFVGSHYVGDLNWTNDSFVMFRPRFDVQPIREFPYNGKNKEGAIEIFELPRTEPGSLQPPWGRYIGGCDPVDDDQGTSLYSVEIFDLFTDTTVAVWTGRLNKADANFEVALKLAIFYNAEINYENKLKGMFNYFDRHNALRYLADTPAILKDMEYIKQEHAFGNKSKGTPPSPTINAWGRRLQADWMMTRNETDPTNKLNLHRIRDIAYLEECIQWTADGNFDRVSRSIMTHILRASKLKYIEGRKTNITSKRDYEDDPFFMDNSFGGLKTPRPLEGIGIDTKITAEGLDLLDL